MEASLPSGRAFVSAAGRSGLQAAPAALADTAAPAASFFNIERRLTLGIGRLLRGSNRMSTLVDIARSLHGDWNRGAVEEHVDLGVGSALDAAARGRAREHFLGRVRGVRIVVEPGLIVLAIRR